MNRLSAASSPYLLQHKDNPVDWWEWGPDAFAEAQRLGRPVLLSVGYAACHWCHVMAHESFEDEATAAIMNALFVAIKVDREERPDVDHVYMSALQLLGQQGGWPLTMFLTPKGSPFWGGTYFPKEPSFDRPGFGQVLREIARVYHAEPDRIAQNQGLLAKSLSKQVRQSRGETLSLADLSRLGVQVAGIIDPEHGGVKGAPKFPNPTILEFLARHGRLGSGAEARDGFLLTLERMALGGIHDHLGGGFARYSTDERWLAPHFEKMLYDNAQLLELFALAAAETGRPLFRQTAEGIVAWLRREMTTPEGAFASSLDADSEGEEGRFYVWSLAEIGEVLGPDAAFFAEVYDITEEGNWEGANIPNLLTSGAPSQDVEARLRSLRQKLLNRRAMRARPGLDDKILADWNGLMVGGLARAALLLDRPEWIGLAEQAYRFIRETMSRDGRLGHSWRCGSLIFPGFALDHAAMMRAALALHEASAEAHYLGDARRWRDILRDEYRVAETGILAMTAGDADRLLVRPQPTHDEAVPNANGVFAEALVRFAALTGGEEDHRTAEDALAGLAGIARYSPVGHASILNAFDLHLRGLTIVVTNDEAGTLTNTALKLPYLNRTVCAAEDPAALGGSHPGKALALAGVGPQALVCAGMRCSLPITRPEDLLERTSEMLGMYRGCPT